MDRQNRPLTILTIDDEEQIQYALRALFNSQGWEAISARDVEEGVGKFRTCRPDLVLMDYHLPKINGVKGVEMLRREDPEDFDCVRVDYLSSTEAPTSSSFFLSSSASSLETCSLMAQGTPSTFALASARPRLVISRTALMTLIF